MAARSLFPSFSFLTPSLTPLTQTQHLSHTPLIAASSIHHSLLIQRQIGARKLFTFSPRRSQDLDFSHSFSFQLIV